MSGGQYGIGIGPVSNTNGLIRLGSSYFDPVELGFGPASGSSGCKSSKKRQRVQGGDDDFDGGSCDDSYRYPRSSESVIAKWNGLSKGTKFYDASDENWVPESIHGSFKHPLPVPISKRKAGNAVSGPAGNNTTFQKGRAFRTAKNRTQPIPYQASVVNYANFPRPSLLYDVRRQNWECAKDRTHQLVAPLGSPDCFVVRKGSPVFTLKGHSPQPPRQSDARNAHISVSDCVNALWVWDDIVFQGCALFNQKPDHSDPVGTIQTAGTITVHHTGPHAIRVGQLVYMSIFPFAYHNDKKQLEPAVRVIGVAGEFGEKDAYSHISKAKFFPALYSLPDLDTAAYLAVLDLEIKKSWERFRVDQVDGSTVEKAIKDVEYDIETRMFSRSAKDLPARDYAKAAILSYLLKRHQDSDDNGKHTEYEIGQVVMKGIHKQFNRLHQMSVRFHNNLGMHSMPYNHPILTPEIRADLADAKHWTSHRRIIQGMTPSVALQHYCQQRMDLARNEQSDFIRSKGMGTALSDSLSAWSLDLNLGHFF